MTSHTIRSPSPSDRKQETTREPSARPRRRSSQPYFSVNAGKKVSPASYLFMILVGIAQVEHKSKGNAGLIELKNSADRSKGSIYYSSQQNTLKQFQLPTIATFISTIGTTTTSLEEAIKYIKNCDKLTLLLPEMQELACKNLPTSGKTSSTEPKQPTGNIAPKIQKSSSPFTIIQSILAQVASWLTSLLPKREKVATKASIAPKQDNLSNFEGDMVLLNKLEKLRELAHQVLITNAFLANCPVLLSLPLLIKHQHHAPLIHQRQVWLGNPAVC